jgi:hypothetical protein
LFSIIFFTYTQSSHNSRLKQQRPKNREVKDRLKERERDRERERERERENIEPKEGYGKNG